MLSRDASAPRPRSSSRNRSTSPAERCRALSVLRGHAVAPDGPSGESAAGPPYTSGSAAPDADTRTTDAHRESAAGTDCAGLLRCLPYLRDHQCPHPGRRCDGRREFSGTLTINDPVLAEQLAYYGARAREYDKCEGSANSSRRTNGMKPHSSNRLAIRTSGDAIRTTSHV
jgi:hypothetical protein